VGVIEVIIAINYLADYIKTALNPLEKKYNIKLTYSRETEAMGTAGPLKLAEEIIRKDNPSGLFFVFNSDVICDFPLQEVLEFHKTHNKDATMVLTKVEDPSRFGVLVVEPDGKVTSFVEKPKNFISNKINAGLYLLNVSVLDRIPLRFCMLERETFP
jgi:mannose-1-phosphate guanylyltransferase